MINKYFKEYLFLIPFLFITSCNTSDKEFVNNLEARTSLTFYSTRSSSQMLENAGVYLFDGEGESTGFFRKKVTDIRFVDQTLSMFVDTGIWDIALVTADGELDISKIISPIRGIAKKDSKMWKTLPENGYLPSMPDLLSSLIERQTVTNIQPEKVETTLSRNIALVRVSIVQAKGLDVNSESTILLHGVPTTLNWEGKLFPDKDNPEVSNVPMKGIFNITQSAENSELQASDVINFYIPGHKGNDYLSNNPNDTTTHKLSFSVDIAANGGARFIKKNIEIPRVPRVNNILDVKLTMNANLDVVAEVIPWEEEEVDVELINTELNIGKASIGISHRDTLFVNTNAKEFTVEKEETATWITSIEKIENLNAVVITADVDSYKDGQPRSSVLTIKAGNVVKKLPITQRPEQGTILVDKKTLTFAPNVKEINDLSVTSIGGEWKFITKSDKASFDNTSGQAGKTSVKFTAASTSDVAEFDKYYGNDIVTIKNMSTLETVDIKLQNCFIYVDDGIINAAAPTGGNEFAVTKSSDVKVYGGSETITQFSSTDKWIYNFNWDKDEQILSFTTDREPSDEARDGKMSFVHADCPDYKETYVVHQDVIVTIPEFDFFVVKFTWAEGDVDIAVEFAGNSLLGNGENNKIYDKVPVGYDMGRFKNPDVIQPYGAYSGHEVYRYIKNSGSPNNDDIYNMNNYLKLLQWGGDAQGGQGETVFFNAPVFENDEESPRKIKLNVYSTWYRDPGESKDMTFTMYAYKGGRMEHVGTNFNNYGGKALYDQSYSVTVPTIQGYASYANGGFTKVATITYDRVKHSASVQVWASSK